MKNLGITALIVIAVGGGAFYGGMKYGENSALSPKRLASLSTEDRQALMQQFRGSGSGMMGTGQGGSGRGRIGKNSAVGTDGTGLGGSFASGDILNKDDKSITIKTRDGGSKIIFFSKTTIIGKMTQGTEKDLTVGESVTINGTDNADGSVNAQNIQLRPTPPPAPTAEKK